MQNFYKVPAEGNLFSSKVKNRGMLSRLLEYMFHNMLCTSSCFEVSIKLRSVLEFAILKLQGFIHLLVH